MSIAPGKMVFRGVMTLLTLCQFMLMQTMAISPILHEDCHHHHDEDHGQVPDSCVVDLIFHDGCAPVLLVKVALGQMAGRVFAPLVDWAKEKRLPRDLVGGVCARGPPFLA